MITKISMDRMSYFIPDKGLFGSYPNPTEVEYLENIGVKYFINLTTENDNLSPYTLTCSEMISFPIDDCRPPTDILPFIRFIIRVSRIIDTLKVGELVYVHCRGGHGRAGVVVASVLCYLFHHHPKDSLILTNDLHNQRKEMREKWRKIGSPQTRSQKGFVVRMFKPLYFFRAFKIGQSVGLSNFSFHPVVVDGIRYMTSEAAYYAQFHLEDAQYVKQLSIYTSPFYIKNKVKKYPEPKPDYHLMKRILTLKVQQNKEVMETLYGSMLRPIVFNNHTDTYWGIGDTENKGQNMLGKLWEEIRLEMYTRSNVFSSLSSE